jgi:AGZA family xanthine/uracil permease-like MFS transporter
MKKFSNAIDKFFKISYRKSNITREIMSGIIVFLAMIYILPVNTQILNEAGISKGAVFAATAIASGVASIIMGLVANFPIALSTGMGLNAFLAYIVCDELGYSWQEGLTLVLISGVIFLIITLSGLRVKIVNAIPKDIKVAISAGIGFFIAFVGLKSAGIIVTNESTLVSIGDLSNPTILLGFFGILLVFTLMSMKGKVRIFAIVIAMFTTALLGYVLHRLNIKDMPNFSSESAGQVSDISHTFGVAFKNFGSVLSRPESYAVIFSLIFVNLFDTTATLVAVGKSTGIIDENGKLQGGQKVMLADATGAVLGGILGTSTITPFAESTIGVESGARTGLSAVVTGLLFLISLAIYPAFSIFSSVGAGYTPVTSMALVLVGALMFKHLKDIDWNDHVSTFSAFLIVIMMVLTYSISDGLGIGIIVYTVMMIASGRRKELSFLMYGITIFFIINFVLHFAVLS